ncbi:MAG: metal-dependent hydrolase [Candidatus Methylacidiphilales bacterium]
MKITFLGHSCIQLEVVDSTILIDPFITPNSLASHVDISSLRPDFIFLTHGHEDHVADAVSIANRSGATVVANFEVANWIASQGVANVKHVNPGGRLTFPFGSIRVVSAIHSSSLPDGSYGGNPMGYLFITSDGHFYHSGDTALTLDMKLIPDFAPLKAAALCIGDTFTMGAEDAALAADFIQCSEIIGIHYDTFPPIAIDHSAAKAAFASRNHRLHLPAIGESVTF